MTGDTDVEEATLTFSVDSVDTRLESVMDFKYLLVRYGNNEQVEQTTIADEARRIQNGEFDICQHLDTDTLRLEVPLRLHPRLGTEFKVFVDVTGTKRCAEVESMLEDSDHFMNVERSYMNDSRIFVLLDDVPTTVSPEGFRNNFMPAVSGTTRFVLEDS